MIRPQIDYRRIADAIEFYAKRNYTYIDVPWAVSEEAVNVTKPLEARPFETIFGHLVASGEQSFIEMRNDLCPSRSYQCVTPCFRDEKISELQLPYFLKNELITVLWKTDDPTTYVNKMIADASTFFRLQHGITANPVVVQTSIGFDINLRGIEIGSYGFREYKGFRWVYGTGVAEPRFSQVLQLRNVELDEIETALNKELGIE